MNFDCFETEYMFKITFPVLRLGLVITRTAMSESDSLKDYFVISGMEVLSSIIIGYDASIRYRSGKL